MKNIRQLNHHELRAKKSLGQNFLVNDKIIKRIVTEARLSKDDNVLEIGPGKGALTFELAKRVKRLVAVEKDERLAELLKSKVPPALRLRRAGKSQELKVLEVLNRDIFTMTAGELWTLFGKGKYKIVANLPYNITSHFLKTFLETDYSPVEMLLMVQKEVGERIVAKPGQMSLLALSVQFFSDPEIVFPVSRCNFTPVPKVDSVIIRLKNITKAKFPVDPEQFFSVIKAGFSSKRKFLRSNLQKFGARQVDEAFKTLGIKPTARAQELSLAQWAVMVRVFAASKPPHHDIRKE